MQPRKSAWAGVIVILVLLGLAIGALVVSQHSYIMVKVDQQEVGVRFRGGKLYEIVGPGVYSDVALYAQLKKVSSEAVAFTIEDPEVITSDRQRVGLRVSGDAFRPGFADGEKLRELWPKYQGVYLNDNALSERMTTLASQAMKACVGDRSFNDNVIGASRDELRICIDEHVNALAEELGVVVKNITVPNVILSAEVQASLDAITKSRLDTELAQQDAIKAKEQSAADQAREEGAIRVELARQQEEVRQKTTLAELERARLVAQQTVIEAEKANDLISAQRDLEINEARAVAAQAAARADLAREVIMAELYTANPAFAYLQALQTNASALSPTDKIIFTPEGTTPSIVIPGAGIMPTVDTTPGAVITPQ